MKMFAYRVISPAGKEHSGEIQADSELKAANILQQQEYYVLSLKEKSHLRKLNQVWKYPKLRIVFCQQMATMLQAGVPLLDSVQTLSADKSFAMAGIENIAVYLQQGFSLAQAMERCGNFFSSYMIAMVKAGETAGTLAEIFDRMKSMLARSQINRKKIQTAMLYPMILMLLSVGLVVFLLYHVIPNFAMIFAGFHRELPWSTQLLLNGSSWLRENLAACWGFLWGMLVLGWMLRRQRKCVSYLDKLLFQLPILGRLYLCQEQALFLSSMSMMIRSGITVNQALSLAGILCSNKYMLLCQNTVAKQLLLGNSLSHSMLLAKVFSGSVITMVRSGEKAGDLASMLAYAGEQCQQEAQEITLRLQALAEPVLLLMVGAGVGFIVVSTVLPVLDMITMFGG